MLSERLSAGQTERGIVYRALQNCPPPSCHTVPVIYITRAKRIKKEILKAKFWRHSVKFEARSGGGACALSVACDARIRENRRTCVCAGRADGVQARRGAGEGVRTGGDVRQASQVPLGIAHDIDILLQNGVRLLYMFL
jgi:hypothetical protein